MTRPQALHHLHHSERRREPEPAEKMPHLKVLPHPI